MRYDALLMHVAREVQDEILRGRAGITGQYEVAITALFDAVAERRPFAQSLEDLAGRVRSIILRWDIRCIGALREKFPQQFPAVLRNGPLILEYDDMGEWIVLKRVKLC